MWRVVVGAACLALLTGAAVAPAGAQPAPASGQPASAAPEIRVGVEERFRFEKWDNVADHNSATDDHRTQARFRTRLWTAVRFGDHLSFNVGLDNESKGQDHPRQPLALDEIVFESLWLDVTPSSRLTMRVGRQNILKGDGLIFNDGTPGDGPRTLYVNGLDATWRFAPHASLEAIVLSEPAHDEYLPVINSTNRLLVEWDEQLAGFYYTDTRPKGLDVQAYALRKWERHDTRPATHPQFQPDRSLNVLGARLAASTPSGWAVTGEFAGEFGTQVPDRAIRAWAGYANVRRRWHAPWTPALLAGVTALSGDSPSTDTVEQWDPVLSRWPKWSEYYIQSLGPEIGNAYWTNMTMWQAEATVAPTRATGLRATYYHITAFHPFPRTPAIFGSGLGRGDLFITRFDFTANANLKGHVMYERFLPGSFYTGDSPGYFFRVELTAGWQKGWKLGSGQ
jgi:hypothetical protein